jgi:hypothetical protein
MLARRGAVAGCRCGARFVERWPRGDGDRIRARGRLAASEKHHIVDIVMAELEGNARDDETRDANLTG